MLMQRAACGFSLIELMIALAIFALLSFLGMPAFTGIIQDSQVRASAQALVSSLQLARAEAIRRNVQVQFRLSNTLGNASVAGGTDWDISADDRSNPSQPSFTLPVQTRSGLEGAQNVRIGGKQFSDTQSGTAPAPAGAMLPTKIVFSSLGRYLPDAANPVMQIDITNALNPNARRLSITITQGGGIRLCDPALALSSNPQGCAG